MNNNFVKTTDENVAKELSATLKLVNNQNGVWTFLNDGKMTFSDNNKDKIVFSNKLEL